MQPGLGIPGVDGTIYASTMWDPDGAGPLTPRLVIGGDFTIAGAVVANRIAAFDQASGTWSAFGAGITGCGTSGGSSIPGAVRALVGMQNGDLVVGGGFTTAGGVLATNIARWDGTSWAAFGGSVDEEVYALAVAPNGDLLVGGSLYTAGTTPISNLARWNGTTWSDVGGGTNSPVSALRFLPNGDLIAGGSFTSAGTINASNIARWDGMTWSSLGSGVAASVACLTTTLGGDVFAGGAFTTAGGTPASCIARWSAGVWTPVSLGITGTSPVVRALATLPSGDVIAGGTFDMAGGLACANIALWNGNAWTPLAAGSSSPVFSITATPTGTAIAGGAFTTGAGEAAAGLAEWTGTAWSLVGSGADGRIEALVQFPNGDVYAGGRFARLGATSARCVARWNGTAWAAIGTGMSGGGSSGPVVSAVVRMPNSDLVAAGDFATAGGVAAANIAHWNGSAWSALGSGTNQAIHAMTVLANGDLVVGGAFTNAGGVAANHIARWDGVAWSALGTGTNAEVTALLLTPTGGLFAGGVLTGTPSSGVVLQWNGSTWSQLGGVFTTSGFGLYANAAVHCLASLPNGDLLAGGEFTHQGVACGSVARWNGLAWSPLAGGLDTRGGPSCGGQVFTYRVGIVSALSLLPNGAVLAGGDFNNAFGPGGTSMAAAYGLARWNGASWSVFGGGDYRHCEALALRTAGDVLAGGAVFLDGPTVATGLARFVPACPALAIPSGSGCTGSGGANVLTATSLPWIGASFSFTATGMPATGLAVGVRGLTTTSTPLAAILPQGAPGCSLLVSPDLLDLYFPTAGAVTASFAIPNTLALAAQTLHQQVVALDLTPSGAITALTSTNSLAITIGWF